MTLVVPDSLARGQSSLSTEDFPMIELPVSRPGTSTATTTRRSRELERVIREVEPDLLDIHEEPFSVAAREWLSAAPRDLPVVLYTAQNVDKRFPPPSPPYEGETFGRAAALYPAAPRRPR